MKHRIFIFLMLLISVAAFAVELEIGGRKFQLEVADDFEEIVRGLMERESLPADGGMLFVFSDVRHHSFWMKNTKIPLDVAFIDAFGVITAIHTMKIEPPRRPGESQYDYENRLPLYPSRRSAAFAIEVNAGTFEELGVVAGDKIDILKLIE